MNADTIFRYIESPGSIPAEASDKLKAILEEYPFFQTAHLLYIKNLHQHKNLRYADQLKIAATYAGDRTLLFTLIKKDHRKEFEEALQNEIQQDSKPVQHEAAPESKIEKTEIKEPEQVSAPDTHTEKDKSASTAESFQTGSQNQEEPAIKPVFESKQDLPAQEHSRKELEEIIHHRLDEIEEEHTINESPQTPTIEEPEIIEIETADIVESNVSQGNSEPDLLDFDYTLDVEEEQPIKVKKAKNPSSKQEEIHPQFIDYMYNFNDQSDEEKLSEDPDVDYKKKKQKSLIDSFLEKRPRIIAKDPHEEHIHEDISIDSIKEKEFMSETLAKIYLKQKNYQGAIKIYQKLSLKYPQKNTYFADQIKEIKKLSNNN